MLGGDGGFAVAAGGAGGDLASGGVDLDVERRRKGGAVLDVAVAEVVEDPSLGEGGGLVVEGTVVEAQDEAGGDVIAVRDLDQIADGELFSGLGTEQKEALVGALRVADGDGICRKDGGGAEQDEGEEGRRTGMGLMGVGSGSRL